MEQVPDSLFVTPPSQMDAFQMHEFISTKHPEALQQVRLGFSA